MGNIKKVKSWKKDKDCFGNGLPNTIDHIYPLSKGGTNILENKQLLSRESNISKADKIRGKIGENWRFSVTKQQRKSDNKIYGVMKIKYKDWDNDHWKEVIPVT